MSMNEQSDLSQCDHTSGGSGRAVSAVNPVSRKCELCGNVVLNDPFMRHISFGEWANNIRTQKLMEWNAALQERIDALGAQVDKLESELRAADSIKNVFIRVAGRRLAQVADLQNTLQEGNDFIELQSQRLLNARNHVLRVRKACDLDPFDSGPSFDV
jgi:dynactin complex subunit